MKTFEVLHLDGTHVKIEAHDEKDARERAMTKKHGLPQNNTTWPCDHWDGKGLSVKEIA